MNNRISSLVAAAMESAEIELQEPVAPLDQPALDEVDVAVSAVDDSHREVEGCIADTETLEEVHGGLESLAASLESLTAPLNPSAATFMNIAAEAHLARVGLNMNDAPIIASFESEEGAEKATKLSLDSVKTKIKAIWEAIKRMFAKVMEAVKAFFKHVMDANHRLEKRAAALEAAVSKIGNNPTHKEIDLGHVLFARLHVGGKVDRTTLSQGLTNVEHLVKDMGENPGQTVAQGAKLTIDVLRAKDEAGVDAVVNSLKNIKFTVPSVFTHKGESKDGQVVHTTVEMPGGTTYSIGVNEEITPDDSGIVHLRKLFTRVGWNKAGANSFKEGATKAETLGGDEILRIVHSAKAVAKQGAALNASIEKVTADIAALGANNAEVKAEQVGAEGAKKISDIYGALAKFGQQYMHIVSDAAAYSTRVLHGYITYAEKSIAAYGVEAPAADAAEDKKDDVAEAA